MKKYNFKLADVNIIHSDTLKQNGMSEIIGGVNNYATMCTCDCLVGNSNDVEKQEDDGPL